MPKKGVYLILFFTFCCFSSSKSAHGLLGHTLLLYNKHISELSKSFLLGTLLEFDVLRKKKNKNTQKQNRNTLETFALFFEIDVAKVLTQIGHDSLKNIA